MGALLLPKGILHQIDKRSRAFFWIGEEHANGGNCKHLSKVHQPGSTPWEQCFSWSYGWGGHRDLGDSHTLDSTIWKEISAGLEFFRSISKVEIGNGLSTAFWLDFWIGDSTLASRFPALFSHSLRPNISVASALNTIDSLTTFQPRLSSMAHDELGDLQTILASVSLNSQVPDHRIGRLDGKVLSTSLAYSAAF
ncbi:hypothetical protein BRADI_4g30882v3 [Brachypodium distachyon]|uniref:Reverse transcriptase zinc-binding domain-containing protein n=1 Tax=Brachypodium distachyon TaxID=15368 RepID=A0A2K2CRJ3_BRADI|nr:hypothetical protein BRADI_4g30882v3 [Brachypodium distachyon]